MNRHRDTQPDKEREWRRDEKGGKKGKKQKKSKIERKMNLD